MVRISDPKSLRALAHPLRIRLLEAVTARGPATATELADLVDESPSNCSFHLRKLAEHGYIERAGNAAGRERPWRIVDIRQQFDPSEDDQSAIAASQAASSSVREWEFARIRTAEGRPKPRSWKGTEGVSGATLFLRPEEARELLPALAEVIEPYLERTSDPTLRPAGAGAFRLFTAMTYLPEYQEHLDTDVAGSPGASDGDAES